MPETNGTGSSAGTPAIITVSPINDTIATFIRLQGQDLSEKQMYVPTDTVLPAGTKVKIEYRVQSFGQKSNVKIIDALAEVFESSIDTSKGRHGVIVRFVKLSPNSQTLIQKVLEKKRQVSARVGTTPDSARPITAQIQRPHQPSAPVAQTYTPPPAPQTTDSTPPGMFGEATVVVPIEKLAKLAKAGEEVSGVPPVERSEPEQPRRWEPPPAPPVETPVQQVPKDKTVEPLKFFTEQPEPETPPPVRQEADVSAPIVEKAVQAPVPPPPPQEEQQPVQTAPKIKTDMNLDLLAAAQEASGGPSEETAAPLFNTLPQAAPGYAETPFQMEAAPAEAESPFTPTITPYQQADNRKILEIVKKKSKKSEDKKAEKSRKTFQTAALILIIVGLWIYTIKVNFFPSAPSYDTVVQPQVEAVQAAPQPQAPPAVMVEKAPTEAKAKGPEMLQAAPSEHAASQEKPPAAPKPPPPPVALKKLPPPPPPPRKPEQKVASEQSPPRRSEEPVITGGPGSLIISSAPLGDIFFDGQPMGRPPVEIKSTPAGKHRVEVKKDGFRTEERTVVVRPGAREAVFIKLTPLGK